MEATGMRVVFVNRYFHPDQSASSRMASALAFALSGFEVHVITSRQLHADDGTTGRDDLPPEAVEHGVVIHRVWTSRLGRGRLLGRLLDYVTFHASATWNLIRIARGGIVVACTDPPLYSISAGIACRVTRSRQINWLQDLFPEVAAVAGVVRPGGWVDGGLRGLRDRSLRAAALNIVPGERMAGYLMGRGLARDALRVIPNWADGQEIHPVPRHANPLRREWGLDGRFVVGYSGNMGRAHELGSLLDAAERLRDRPDIRFLLIGAGHRRAWIRDEIGRRGLANVVLRPLQPRALLAQSLCVADVHVVSLLAELEGFVVPSKFYAATAAGRPVLFVGDPDGEIARLVAATGCGAAVAAADGLSLAAEIRRLADDPRRYRTLSANAREAFEARFNQAAAVAAWTEALAAVAGPVTAGGNAPAIAGQPG